MDNLEFGMDNLEFAIHIRTAMDTLATVDTGETIVSMLASGIYYRDCGTVACFAGWYAIATHPENYKGMDYIFGATRLARDLGFNEYAELKQWAKENPVLWGNTLGDSMFCSAFAYGIKHHDITLGIIIAHWRGVADRLDALAKPLEIVVKGY